MMIKIEKADAYLALPCKDELQSSISLCSHLSRCFSGSIVNGSPASLEMSSLHLWEKRWGELDQ